MNFRNESFPNDFRVLIEKSENTANDVQKRLQNRTCPRIGELFEVNNNKLYRKKDFFDLIQTTPNTKNEIKGLYIFGEQIHEATTPIYVGISGGVCKRIKDHLYGKTHFQATLAFLTATIAQEYKGKREDFDFAHVSRHQQQVMKNYKVAVVPEVTDYDLYFMEVYIAGKLKTKWNSFKTH